MYKNAPKSIQITSSFEGPNLTTQMMDSFIPAHLKQRKTEEYHWNWAGWTAAMYRARVVCTCVMVSFFQQPPSLGRSGSAEIRVSLGMSTRSGSLLRNSGCLWEGLDCSCFLRIYRRPGHISHRTSLGFPPGFDLLICKDLRCSKFYQR